MSLAAQDNFQAIGKARRHVLCHPQWRSAVHVARDEQGGHRRAHRSPKVRGIRDLRPLLAGRLLLTCPIVAEISALRFAHDVFFTHERDVIVAGDGEEQTETQTGVGTASIGQHAFRDRPEFSRCRRDE